MTDFSNPTDIFPVITDITHLIPGLIKDLPAINMVLDSMFGYNYLGLVIEYTYTAEVIQNSK